MLRVGEFTQLKWGDVVGTEIAKDDAGLEVNLVTINIRKEITKTKKARQVITRGGEYLKRLHSRAKYTGKMTTFLLKSVEPSSLTRRNSISTGRD